jgi:hypothetical protein
MEATLQLIMERLKELCTIGTGQEALKSEISTTITVLKSDICAEVKSDMSKIRANLITQVHAMENKMGNCISVTREELETQIGDSCAGQAELEKRPHKQQKNRSRTCGRISR